MMQYLYTVDVHFTRAKMQVFYQLNKEVIRTTVSIHYWYACNHSNICIAHMISCDHIVVGIISWTKSWYRLQGHSQYRRYITLMICIVYVFYTVDANGLGDPVRRSHITKSIVHKGNDEVELHVVISKNSRATRV